MPTTRRLPDRIDAAHPDAVRQARKVTRERATDAGADLRQELSSTSTQRLRSRTARTEHRRGLETHLRIPPVAGVLDRPDIAARRGSRRAAPRPGNAGSNTAAAHLIVLEHALAALRGACPPRAGDRDSPRVLARSDSGQRHPGDRSRWRPAVRRAGGQGHRHDRPGHLAGRRSVDLAEGTPPSRRAAAILRSRLDARDRIPHRYPAAVRAGEHRRSGATSSSAHPRRGPDPAGQSGRAARPTTTPFATPRSFPLPPHKTGSRQYVMMVLAVISRDATNG